MNYESFFNKIMCKDDFHWNKSYLFSKYQENIAKRERSKCNVSHKLIKKFEKC